MSDTDTDTNLTITDLTEVGEAVVAGPESLKEGLRRQRQEAILMEPLLLPLPEYKNPELVAKYNMVDPNELGRLGDKIRHEFKTTIDRSLYGAIDSMILACEGLYARLPGTSELISLSDDESVPMKFDARLAEYMGFDSTTAREVVMEVFGRNIFAIINHNITISRWMADRKADLGDGLGGL